MPRAFRGERPEIPLPADVHKYRPRTVVEEYRTLAIVFGIIAYFVAWLVMPLAPVLLPADLSAPANTASQGSTQTA